MPHSRDAYGRRARFPRRAAWHIHGHGGSQFGSQQPGVEHNRRHRPGLRLYADVERGEVGHAWARDRHRVIRRRAAGTFTKTLLLAAGGGALQFPVFATRFPGRVRARPRCRSVKGVGGQTAMRSAMAGDEVSPGESMSAACTSRTLPRVRVRFNSHRGTVAASAGANNSSTYPSRIQYRCRCRRRSRGSRAARLLTCS
jgi:hypothetical protein